MRIEQAEDRATLPARKRPQQSLPTEDDETRALQEQCSLVQPVVWPPRVWPGL